ncbi:MAG: helix-turn-helix domain-containing protein [Clostridiales bacterium]|nr:helix-turn-helix domain-containing protein [Clostridiales bacterium]
MNIADRIQNLRKVNGISQEELADKVGVSRQAVSKWESEQSVPDIDKIVIMSEYFNVTTDYILKGIESQKQGSEKAVNANVFVIVATALNFIGLITACAVWYEKQVAMALVIGLVFMAVGCMVFGVGFLNSSQNTKGNAKRNFWAANIWLLCFIPFSVVYNGLFSRFTAPYPLLTRPPVTFLSFCLVYLAVCGSVAYIQIKGRKSERGRQ